MQTDPEIEEGRLALSDLTNVVRALRAMNGDHPPDTMVIPMRNAIAIDRVRVRYGLHPITLEGVKYSNRRRRMARKKRRGYP